MIDGVVDNVPQVPHPRGSLIPLDVGFVDGGDVLRRLLRRKLGLKETLDRDDGFLLFGFGPQGVCFGLGGPLVRHVKGLVLRNVGLDVGLTG